MRRALFAALLLATPAYAQPATPYVAPDAELWSLLVRALRGVNAPADTHDAIASILANVQQEARLREVRAKAQQPKVEDGK